MIANIGITQLVLHTAPAMKPRSSWLSPGQVDFPIAFSQGMAQLLVWVAVLGLAGIIVALTLWSDIRKKRVSGRAVLAIMLVGAGLAWSAPLLLANPYESIFVLTTIMLGLLLAFAKASGKTSETILAPLSGACAVVAIVCAASAWIIYGPTLAKSADRSGYIASQPYSVAPFGYAALHEEIRGAADLCRMGTHARQERLLIDDATYFAFMESRLPEHQLGVIGLWRGGIDDPIAYLRSRNSSGIVVGCHLLPADIRARSVSYGRICCLNLRD